MLLDGLALEGIRFPKDLLLFRKTFFTLEGVLFDLHPSFDIDRAMVEEMTQLFLSEAPQRWASWMFPLMDRSENYRSLISNLDLRILVQHFVTAFFRRGANMMAAFMGTGLGMFFGEEYSLKAEV